MIRIWLLQKGSGSDLFAKAASRLKLKPSFGKMALYLKKEEGIEEVKYPKYLYLELHMRGNLGCILLVIHMNLITLSKFMNVGPEKCQTM